jgi:hypothetical protein
MCARLHILRVRAALVQHGHVRQGAPAADQAHARQVVACARADSPQFHGSAA